MIVQVVPICLVVGIMLVSIVIKLSLRMGISGYSVSFAHNFSPNQVDICRIRPTFRELSLPETSDRLPTRWGMSPPFLHL